MHHYQLLGYKQSSNGTGPRIQATGAVAEFLDGLSAEPVAVRRVRRLVAPLARLSGERGVEVLGLDASLDEKGRLQGRATGLAAPLISGMVRHILADLTEHKTAATIDGSKVCYLYQPPIPSEAFARSLAVRLFSRVSGSLRPTFCTLQVTTRCQCDCVHCSAALFTDHSRQELTTEEMKAVVSQALEMGVINVVYTGGEPLLRRDIYELVAHVPRTRANVMMFTNGWNLTADNARRLKDAGLFSIQISLDDYRPECHDQARRLKGCFHRALDGARRAREAGLLVGLSTYATHQKVEAGELEKMVELARKAEVHELTIFDAVPTGRLMKNREILLTPDDKRRIIELQHRCNATPEPPVVVTQAQVNGPTGYGCFAMRHQFYMTAFGDVTPCDFTPLKLGNVRETRLLDIWDRALTHPAYRQRSMECRMQCEAFRKQHIEPIPAEVQLPFDAFGVGGQGEH
jgi:MoaA/NifB/PqqE/SkfB family radical SAM enzyme